MTLAYLSEPTVAAVEAVRVPGCGRRRVTKPCVKLTLLTRACAAAFRFVSICGKKNQGKGAG